MTERDAAEDLGETAKSEPLAEPVPPIVNRFLFVDVAALRAKQLWRGSIPRLDGAPAGDEADTTEAAAAPADVYVDVDVDLAAPASTSAVAETITPVTTDPPRKLERVAMEEVVLGLVTWDLSAPSAGRGETS